jgi:hypothetical protein
MFLCTCHSLDFGFSEGSARSRLLSWHGEALRTFDPLAIVLALSELAE